jgi:hypothetical protein
MLKTISLIVALSTLPLGASAQAADGTALTSAAPIVRSRPGLTGQVATTEPMRGVWLRSEPNGSTRVVSTTGNATEIRVEHGRANVQVYHPAEHAQISVDLPGGKVDLLKDGFYTFNADTNTVRVLHGEAASYPGGTSDAKPVKVKEDHEYAFNGKPSEVPYDEIGSDVLPGGGPGAGGASRGDGYAPGYGAGYGYGPYGDGYPAPYPYPYYAYGYGYPYGFYPYYGFGLGFGYYGGFRGGFRGRFR